MRNYTARSLVGIAIAVQALAACAPPQETLDADPNADGRLATDGSHRADSVGDILGTRDGTSAADASAEAAFDATMVDSVGDVGDASRTDARADVASDTARDSGVDPFLPRRLACEFGAGDRVAETLGFTAADRSRIPLRHVIVLMNENRSFDHYLGRLRAFGHADADGFPATYTNPNPAGGTVSPRHATTTCISPDAPHSWGAMHNHWNGGRNDAFYSTTLASTSGNAARVLTWYDERDLPFYYWMYSTFAMSDRFFSSVLGPTWPNRDYLYAGTSDGVRNTGERAISVPTIFQSMSAARVTWRVYANNLNSRQDCIGWANGHAGVVPYNPNLLNDLRSDNLPDVAFVDPVGSQDEHPSGDIQGGEAWTRAIVTALIASPAWRTTALIVTYDEAGGFFDHVPPPTACRPTTRAGDVEFNRLGFRVPFAVVSPWARPGYVSHVRHETASVTRFIELLHDLPALTARDANAGALLDLFDFTTPALMGVTRTPPAAGTGGCP